MAFDQDGCVVLEVVGTSVLVPKVLVDALIERG
jgi:hypothetical protein